MLSIRLLTLIFSLLIISSIRAKDENVKLSDVWKNYTENKYQIAFNQINEYLKTNKSDLEGHLLGLELATLDGNINIGIDHLESLINIVDDPNPYIHFYTNILYPAVYSNNSVNKVLKFLLKQSTNPKLNEDIKGEINVLIARSYFFKKDIKKAAEYASKTKAITNWQLLGSFNNIKNCAYEYDEPLNHPEEYVFQGKYGSQISWYPMVNFIEGDWIDLVNYNGDKTSSCFAQSFVNSATDQECYISIGISGFMKLYLNDNLIVEEPKERNNGIDSYKVKVKLNAGYNRILVHLGKYNNNSMNFLLRFLDLNGKPIDNLTSTNEIQKYKKDNSKVVKGTYQRPYRSFFEKLASEKSEFPDLRRILYIKNRIDTESYENCIEEIEEMDLKYTQWTRPLILLNELYQRIDNFTLAQEVARRIEAKDETSVFNFNYMYSELINKEDYKGAEALLESKKNLMKEEEYLMNLIDVKAKNRNEEGVYETIEYAYKKYPNNVGFINFKILVCFQQRDKISTGLELLESYLDEYRNTDFFRMYVRALISLQKTNEANKYLDKNIQYYFNDANIYYSFAELFKETTDYKRAEDFYKKVLEFNPYLSGINADLGELNESKKINEAIVWYKKAIASYPYAYTSIRKLRDLTDQKNPFDIVEEQDYYKLAKEAVQKEKEHNISILVDEETIVINADGACEKRIVFLQKVHNEEGIDKAKHYTIGYYGNEELNVEKVEIIKANGNKSKAEISGNRVVFPNLQIGDATLVVYKLKYYSLPLLDKEITHTRYVDNSSWTKSSKLTIIIDTAYKNLNYKVLHQQSKEDKKTKGQYNIITFEKNDIPELVREYDMPNYLDYGESILISTFKDWAQINNWYQKLSNTSYEVDILIDRTIKEIFPKGTANVTTLDKAKSIYKYIVKNIRYSSVDFRNSGLIPQEPSDVIATKLGDCKDVSLLFKRLGEKVGISSNLILVSTKENGRKQFAIPSIDFDHCMILLKDSDKKYFVELTTDLRGFYTIFPGSLNSAYLEIGKDASNKIEYIQSDLRVSNSIKTTIDLRFIDDKLTASASQVYFGSEATNRKSSLKAQTKKEIDEYFENKLPNIYPNASIINYDYSKDFEILEDTFSLRYNYETTNVLTQLGDMFVFSIPHTLIKENFTYIQNKTRQTPVCLWKTFLDFDEESEEIIINYPIGKIIKDLPKNVNINNSIFDYSIEYKVEKDKCIVTRKSKIKQTEVEVADYKLLVDSFKQMVTAEKAQLAFVNAPVENTSPTTKGKKAKKG
jgi:tetratricopeptide (TPR) repeat protein